MHHSDLMQPPHASNQLAEDSPHDSFAHVVARTRQEESIIVLIIVDEVEQLPSAQLLQDQAVMGSCREAAKEGDNCRVREMA